MKELREKFMRNMGYFIVLIDVAIYFILSYVYVDGFQANILATIVNSALLFVGAIIADTALLKQGILRGRENEKYKETLQAHISQKNKIYPKIKYLQPWLDKDYYKLLKIGRTVYVNSAGYDYSELFTEEGKLKSEFKIEKPKKIEYTKWHQIMTAWIRRFFRWIFSDEWKIYRQKKSFIKKAKRYKITRQTVSYLINIDEDRDPNNFGITESQYTKKQSGLSTISRLVFSILLQSIAFGFYGFNMQTFLTQALSVVLILVSSSFSMFNAYFFMVKTHRETIIKKINKLEEFEHTNTAEFKNENNTEPNKQENIEEAKTDEICTALSILPQSNMVEEIHNRCENGTAGDICGDPATGV